MSELRVAAVIPARNEEQFLGRTLGALQEQSHRLWRIIVVNDGSTDSTGRVAVAAGAHVINLKDRGYNVLGTPILAGVVNRGLEELAARGFGNSSHEYVLILGADHILPRNYVSTLLGLVESDRSIAVCSGQIRGERSVVPRGSGRLVRADVWNQFGLRYPENFGFETYLLIKVQQQGYKIAVLNDLVTETLRRTGKHYKKGAYISYGKSLRALGYSGLYSAARIFLTSIRHPLGAYYMLQGYLGGDVQSYDPSLRAYLTSIQHRRIKHYVTNPLKALAGEAA